MDKEKALQEVRNAADKAHEAVEALMSSMSNYDQKYGQDATPDNTGLIFVCLVPDGTGEGMDSQSMISGRGRSLVTNLASTMEQDDDLAQVLKLAVKLNNPKAALLAALMGGGFNAHDCKTCDAVGDCDLQPAKDYRAAKSSSVNNVKPN